MSYFLKTSSAVSNGRKHVRWIVMISKFTKCWTLSFRQVCCTRVWCKAFIWWNRRQVVSAAHCVKLNRAHIKRRHWDRHSVAAIYRESMLRLNPTFALSNITTEETLRQPNSCVWPCSVPALLSVLPKCSPSVRLHAGDWADDPVFQQQGVWGLFLERVVKDEMRWKGRY